MPEQVLRNDFQIIDRRTCVLEPQQRTKKKREATRVFLLRWTIQRLDAANLVNILLPTCNNTYVAERRKHSQAESRISQRTFRDGSWPIYLARKGDAERELAKLAVRRNNVASCHPFHFCMSLSI